MDIYESIGIQRVINASGRMTSLGGSTLEDAVADAMVRASRDYIEIESLHQLVGQHIASLTGAEAAMVTTGAAAGVALMVAATITGDNLLKIQSLPHVDDGPYEVLIQAGHQINFGAPVRQMIALGGGQPRSIGSVNAVHEDHLVNAIGPTTTAFLFIQSHHCVQKGMLSLDQCIEICHDRGIPVLVDAAAEEDLRLYTSSGADLVTFSGGKAIGGPASGIVAGRTDLVEACLAQNSGIGRPMKVGKETILGLAQAVTLYEKRDKELEVQRQQAIINDLIQGLADCSGVTVKRLPDEAGRGIERLGLQLSPEAAATLVELLRSGSPPIFPRQHLLNLGIVSFDPRPLTKNDTEVIVRRVREALCSE